MLAARYEGNQTIGVADVDAKTPGRGEVQIAVAYTGICGTDLHILHGAMDSRVVLPAILGHEMSGRLVAIGDGVDGWSVGDAVTVMPLRWCGTCPACRAGNSHICHHLDFVGIDSPGSLQRLWTVPADLLIHLPADMSLQHAALVEPTAVAVHDVRRAACQPGEQAVIVGGGPIGLLISCVARSFGADVLVLEVDAFRRSVLESIGITAVDPTAVDLDALVTDWTSGAGASVAFEVSGSAPGLDSAMAVLGVRGRLVIVGIHPQPRSIDLHRVFWRELSILGARVYQRTDFERAVELIAGGHIPTEALITAVEPLSSAGQAFLALDSGHRTMKILIDCR